MKILYIKVESEVCKRNRQFYKNHVRKAFIAWLAYEGYFDGVFSKQEIKKAKRGQLPADCNIHHKTPLSGSNDGEYVNSFDNLVVLHKTTHEKINREVFQPQLNPIIKAPTGTQIEIDVPEFGYVDRDGILKARSVAMQMFRKNKRER